MVSWACCEAGGAVHLRIQVPKGRSKYVILALFFAAWCLGNMDRMLMSFAAVQIGKEFNLSASLIGLAFSSFFIDYAIMQVPGGWLTASDRLRTGRAISIYLCANGRSLFAIARGNAALRHRCRAGHLAALKR
jgi:MFS family permease